MTGRSNIVMTAIIWALLLTAPFWLHYVGGYTSLGSRVVVLGLAAMSLNFLLGFTGVLSFGHAAYFGLGAYGAGLALKYLALSTPLAVIIGILLGGICGSILGLLIVRRRGRIARLLTPAAGLRPVQARHLVKRQDLLFLRAVLLCHRGKRHGIYPA